MIDTLTDRDIGKWVIYNAGHQDAEDEEGRIKSFRLDVGVAYVVYHCDGNWARFDQYTGEATPLGALRFKKPTGSFFAAPPWEVEHKPHSKIEQWDPERLAACLIGLNENYSEIDKRTVLRSAYSGYIYDVVSVGKDNIYMMRRDAGSLQQIRKEWCGPDKLFRIDRSVAPLLEEQ